MRGDHRPEVVEPAAHGFLRDRDPALREQILDVTKAECEPEIEPNRLIDDLGREPISGVADFPHTLGYSAYVDPTSGRRRDKALLIAAGGHGGAGAPAGDTLVAFALPRPGESGPSPWLRWHDQPGGRFKLHAGMGGTVVLALVAAA